MLTRLKSSASAGGTGESPIPTGNDRRAGLLIVNADDWGRDRETTERILECVQRKAVSSVSAMVFMADSERAAAMARDRGIDAGIHLNFTTPFSASGTPARLIAHQERISRYLRRHRFAPAMFHPGLTRSFEYVVAAQFDEFNRLYGRAPNRIDGHHHMHLCANVLLQKLLPSGTIVRRNFTFRKGEKGLCNRVYRRLVDGVLRRRHRLADCLFALPPLAPVSRLQQILSLARDHVVEIETHPVNPEEYRFLAGGEIFRCAGDLAVGSSYKVPRRA
jgi:predicted glycoside hydrolase/deacetylase ChbG (UPF0249 family)